MADSDKFDAFLTFLRRAHRDGIKTTEDIKADALNAAAAMVDGTTMVEITFEGAAAPAPSSIASLRSSAPRARRFSIPSMRTIPWPARTSRPAISNLSGGRIEP